MIKETLRESIKKALAAQNLSKTEIDLEHPADFSHGDYSSNVAMVLGRSEGKNPKELAEEIVRYIEQNKPDEVEKVEVAGPGFINFYLSREYFTDTVSFVGEKWGSSNLMKGKKVMFEYTDPNPFKAFHIGHLMSNAIGESLSRLAEGVGAEAKRVNYQGDVGLHVAKALWALQHGSYTADNPESLGEAYTFGNAQYEENEEVRKEIAAINKKIYEKDASVLELYEKGRKTSLEHFEELYDILGTTFDHYFFEGAVWKKGVELVEEGLEKGILEKSEGAVVFKGEKYGLHTRVFLTKEGLPTYEAKDLGLAFAKTEAYPLDLSITITAVEQKAYFDVVFKVLALLRPETDGKFIHISHGMMQLASGKMSSRKGNVITGESLITDMRKMAFEKMAEREGSDEKKEAIADAVGVSAIKYTVLRQSLNKNIAFDPEASLSFEGDSGPYLQYAHVRAKSVLEKAGNEGEVLKVPENITNLERLMVRFPMVVERAAKEYEPHHVTTYLTELAGAFNSWYASEKIIGSEYESYHLALTSAFAHTMKNGLWLLGIEAPVRM